MIKVSLFISVVSILSFPNLSFAGDDQPSVKVQASGLAYLTETYGRTTPEFVDDAGVVKAKSIVWRTGKVAQDWTKLVGTWRGHVTFVGLEKDGEITVYAVEKFGNQSTNNENWSIRLEADLAWEKIKGEILKNERWKSVFIREDFSKRRSYGFAPNLSRLLLLGNLVDHVIGMSDDEELLRTFVAIGDFAKKGLSEEQIESFMSAVKQILSAAEPTNVKNLRNSLAPALTAKCVEMLSPEQTSARYKEIVTNLKSSLGG